MKAITFALLASFGSHTVIPAASAVFVAQSAWYFKFQPSIGFTNITFPLTIVQTAHASGYFFTQEFFFTNPESVGYVGLQPRPDIGTQPRLHAAFSSFVDGSTTTDSNCSPGADDGPGVSCSVEFNGVYNRTYDLEVVRSPTSSQTWIGTAVDTVNHSRYHIGSYTLPSNTGNLWAAGGSFVEWFLENIGKASQNCPADLPYQKSVFGVPRTSSDAGIEFEPIEADDCKGKVAFHAEEILGGDMQCESGFK